MQSSTIDKAGPRAWYAVGLLGALYIVAFLDRVILALLVEPIREQFNVSDTQISLLIGFNFALFYALVGIPMGRLADRVNRRNLIILTSIVWASCTFFSGMASAFWVLCLLRIGVAIGEAALSPSVISMIGDLFPQSQRGRATSIYMALGALGATGGYMLGGQMVGAIGDVESLMLPVVGSVQPWQAVFFAAAAPAAVLTLLIVLTLEEPKRIQHSSEDSHAISGAWLHRQWRPLLLLFLAGAIGQIIVRGLVAWTPSYLHREFDWAISDAGISMGLITMICGVGGMVIVPALTEAWLRSGKADAPPLVLTAGMASGAVFTLIAAFAPTADLFLTALGATMFVTMGTGVLIMVSIQLYAPAQTRGEFMAVCLLLTALIADGIGPSVVPVAAGLIGGEEAPLNLGFAVAAIAGPLGCIFALMARPGLMTMGSKSAVPPHAASPASAD
ncbi:permeases of the major facilitator superfamily [alpha proteobacterium U9-1i]|nr:permeases of the major facilitator superfamily [alpha proteobacterium U9-1i]